MKLTGVEETCDIDEDSTTDAAHKRGAKTWDRRQLLAEHSFRECLKKYAVQYLILVQYQL